MTFLELLAAALGLALLFATRLSARPTYEETYMPDDDLDARAAPYKADLAALLGEG